MTLEMLLGKLKECRCSIWALRMKHVENSAVVIDGKIQISGVPCPFIEQVVD